MQGKPANGKATDTRSRVIAAALRCFARDGARGCSMADIARDAGITRVTIYRLFDNRTALVREIVEARFAAIIDRVEQFIGAIGPLDQAIVAGAGHALALARADALLIDLLEHGGDGVDAFLIQLTPAIRERYAAAWRPRFVAARRSGELASTLPDDRLIDGMLTIASPILLRRDFDADDQRRFIADFVLPAIFRS